MLGNHEYDIDGAVGYFRYFNGVGEQAGRVGQKRQTAGTPTTSVAGTWWR